MSLGLTKPLQNDAKAHQFKKIDDIISRDRLEGQKYALGQVGEPQECGDRVPTSHSEGNEMLSGLPVSVNFAK